MLRPARLSDVSALRELETRCFSGDRLSRRSFVRFLKLGKAILVVAEDAGQLVGYALALPHPKGELVRIYSLAVAPEQRGQGLGRRLIEDIEHRAARLGAHSLRLEVSRDNPAAHGLYLRLGYVAFGERPGYYEDGSTAVRMEKAL